MKSDGTNLFVVHGNLIGKVNVPDLQVIFLEETLHTDAIIDFNLSGSYIFTT